ncbi:hypothetical protein [Phormidium sp. CCY1219]|uniref:hypothetical protein n=1 Tax=Phormidium sp. CCY1219 TaxID=2886104 RepID=UPI002D1E8AF4|nr:hypothetical protein [Phormidium sp. CCY1219]MEB3830477.1 hypothetical protein [Phormidium sp. CCY1219]
MADIRKLLEGLSDREAQLRETQFVAPCVQSGRVRIRVAGMIYTFKTQPRDFEGWGIFQPTNETEAKLVEEAEVFHIADYLSRFLPVRLWLAYRLKGQTWLAYPMNESDLRQRIGFVKPIAVHLVGDGAEFEPIIARWDGKNWWFEEGDRRADPMPSDRLRKHLQQIAPPETVRFKGMTPEMRTVYELVTRQMAEFNPNFQHQQDEKRLREALRMGGGELQRFRDRGEDYWTVEWTTSTGELHTSAISKSDFTVIGAGICLSGRDRDFDLHSLVGVIENS